MGDALMPSYDLPKPDPRYDQLMERTRQQDILSIQDGLKIDTASIMARYGSLLSVAQGNAGAPPAATSPTTRAVPARPAYGR